MKKITLNHQLKNWAKQAQADQEHLNRISERISTSLNEEDLMMREPSPSYEPAPVLWPKLAWSTGGIALGFALALFLLHAGLMTDKNTNGEAISLAQISPIQMQEKKLIFDELEGMFPERLRWIASSGEHVEMGVAGTATVGAETEPMLIRLVVLRKGHDENAWKQVWDADMLARRDELVEWSPNPGQDNRLYVWICPNEDGTLVVESHVTLEMPVAIASSTSSVVEPGKPVQLMKLQTDDAEYCVYQTVDWLTCEKG